jgi:hypothetical protein
MNKYLEKIAEGLRDDLYKPRTRLKAPRGVKAKKVTRVSTHKIKTSLKASKRLRDRSIV